MTIHKYIFLTWSSNVSSRRAFLSHHLEVPKDLKFNISKSELVFFPAIPSLLKFSNSMNDITIHLVPQAK